MYCLIKLNEKRKKRNLFEVISDHFPLVVMKIFLQFVLKIISKNNHKIFQLKTVLFPDLVGKAVAFFCLSVVSRYLHSQSKIFLQIRNSSDSPLSNGI